MSRIQDDINHLFEQKRQADFADSIVDRKSDDFEKFIEQQKQNTLLTDSIVGKRNEDFEEFLEQQKQNALLIKSQQEFAYENSMYYYCYNNLIANLDSQIMDIYCDMANTCQHNLIYFRDPFFRGVKITKLISGIGYPIPDKYLQNLYEVLKEKISQVCVFENGKIDIELIPTQYITNRDASVAKLFNGYILKIELNRENKKHKVLK